MSPTLKVFAAAVKAAIEVFAQGYVTPAAVARAARQVQKAGEQALRHAHKVRR